MESDVSSYDAEQAENEGQNENDLFPLEPEPAEVLKEFKILFSYAAAQRKSRPDSEHGNQEDGCVVCGNRAQAGKRSAEVLSEHCYFKECHAYWWLLEMIAQ